MSKITEYAALVLNVWLVYGIAIGLAVAIPAKIAFGGRVTSVVTGIAIALIIYEIYKLITLR